MQPCRRRRLPGRRPPVGREWLRVDSRRVLGRHGLPELQQAGAEVLQDPGGDAFTFARQTQQQILGAEAVVIQLHRLAPRQGQHQREGLGGRPVEAHARRTRTLADGLHDPATDRLRRDAQPAQSGHGEALLVREEREQQVLGADTVVPEPAGAARC
jgi:hypothetical protein